MRYLFILFFAICMMQVTAQDVFIPYGKIEFERKVNMFRSLEDRYTDDDDKSWLEQMKKMTDEWNTTYFDLYFDSTTTLYKPGREVVETKKTPDWFQGPANDNTVYHNLNTGQSVAQKKVYEGTFLLQDSLRNTQWHITNDHREVAGFDCRRAWSVVMDSLFVVAFYTDQIITPGGPESFCGLPGMILGLAVPRLHTTWFATKVEYTPVTAQQLTPPQKGKKANNNQLLTQLKTLTKNWEKEGRRIQWQVML